VGRRRPDHGIIGRMAARVTVIGAGVIGLSCGVRLAEAGYEVNLMARDLPQETTSSVAGALWLPYRAEPAAEVARWGRVAFEEFARLAVDPATGVRILPGRLLFRRPPARPEWADGMADVAPLRSEPDPAPGYRYGLAGRLPVVDMAVYLDHLVQRLAEAGGTLTRMALPALPSRGLVVNCTGVAARSMAADPQVRPVRGQVVLVENPGLDEWWCDNEAEPPTYVLPRGRYVVLGGTADEDDWSTTPVEETARRIVERTAAIVPRLRDAKVVAHRVGLRPGRPRVRLETVRTPTAEDADRTVVHCYGHGGSGVTVSWGCADDVVTEVGRVVGQAPGTRPGEP
jgi:D-amino-acid oxidase